LSIMEFNSLSLTIFENTIQHLYDAKEKRI
jgi:hypothetical protein